MSSQLILMNKNILVQQVCEKPLSFNLGFNHRYTNKENLHTNIYPCGMGQLINDL